MADDTIAQLAMAEALKNDIVEKTNKVRLEMIEMQSHVYKKKVLAEAKVQEDKEDKMRRKVEEDHRQAVAALQADHQQKKLV